MARRGRAAPLQLCSIPTAADTSEHLLFLHAVPTPGRTSETSA
jgi:hypothetical protein